MSLEIRRLDQSIAQHVLSSPFVVVEGVINICDFGSYPSK
jgi:hypothetical protein